jgi:hypothetical protein
MPRGTKRAAPTKPSRAVTALLAKDTLAYAEALNAAIRRREKAILSHYTPRPGAFDAFDPLEEVWEAFASWYADFDASIRAADGIKTISKTAKRRWLETVQQVLGVSALDILQDPAIGAPFDEATAAYMQYFDRYGADTMGKLKDAAFRNFTGQKVPEGNLQAYLQKLYAGTAKHARFVALDINATYTATFSRLRAQSIGLTEYAWTTAGDRFVVGAGVWKPSPMHGNHFLRSGNTYSYEHRFEDGHPGEAIGCRCLAMPIVPTDPSQLTNLSFV